MPGFWNEAESLRQAIFPERGACAFCLVFRDRVQKCRRSFEGLISRLPRFYLVSRHFRRAVQKYCEIHAELISEACDCMATLGTQSRYLVSMKSDGFETSTFH